MASKSAERWIAAGTHVREHPDEVVMCPDREDGPLEITNVDWPDGSRTDVYMKCNRCGAENVMTFIKMSRPS
jgi:hypothetical protein